MIRKMYVIGPVTGIEKDNRPAFEAAARALHDAYGCEVEIPHDTIPAGTDWGEAMHQSLSRLAKADAVAMLDGWTASRGATIEFQFADLLRHYNLMQVRTVKDWLDDAPKAA